MKVIIKGLFVISLLACFGSLALADDLPQPPSCPAASVINQGVMHNAGQAIVVKVIDSYSAIIGYIITTSFQDKDKNPHTANWGMFALKIKASSSADAIKVLESSTKTVAPITTIPQKETIKFGSKFKAWVCRYHASSIATFMIYAPLAQ